MTEDHREQLRRHLVADEGLRLYAYQDSLGYWTIGVGHLIDKRKGGKIPAKIAYQLLEIDIDEHLRDLLARFPWVEQLDPVRQVALANLTFNMGIDTLSEFVNSMAAVQRGDWEAAVRGFKASKWYQQVQPSRSDRILYMIRNGEYPNEARA